VKSNVEKQLDWIKRTKERMILAMGSKCQCCGYNKSHAALEFHHINPDEKEFGLGRWKSRCWEKIVSELRKCVMVCSNCHKEIHAGVRKIPKRAKRFNEDYAEYKISMTTQRKCLFCGDEYDTKINSKSKYCSYECSRKVAQRVDWDKIDLQKELRTKTIAQIARELNVSWNCVKKHIKRL
jgi:hypothetical protein